jgi:hydrogenase maturation protease
MTLVIGLGHPDRGDDAVGLIVARRLAAQPPAGVTVVAHEDPMELVLAWADRRWALVVDAVVSGAAPGTVTVREIADGPAGASWSRVALGGTHGLGLGEAVELSRTLDRLPGRVTLVGIEAADVTAGAGLTRAVAAAVPEALELVGRILDPSRMGAAHVSR